MSLLLFDILPITLLQSLLYTIYPNYIQINYHQKINQIKENQIKATSLTVFNLLNPTAFTTYNQLPKTNEQEALEADQYLKANLTALQDKIIENLQIYDPNIKRSEFVAFLQNLDHLKGTATICQQDRQIVEEQIKLLCQQGNFNKGALKQIAQHVNEQRLQQGQVTVKMITLQVFISRYIHKNTEMLIQLAPKDKQENARQFLSKTRNTRQKVAQQQENNAQKCISDSTVLTQVDKAVTLINQLDYQQRLQNIQEKVVQLAKLIQNKKYNNTYKSNATYNTTLLSNQQNISSDDIQTQTYENFINSTKEA